MKPYLSVIIPAYNEQERITLTLQRVAAFLQQQTYSSEIIVVDDGSLDQTSEMVQSLPIPHLSCMRLPQNKGKGAAVKAGVLAAKGQGVLYMDADNSTDIKEVEKLLPYLTEGYDVVVGSRRAKGANIQVQQNVIRTFLGGTFRFLVHTLTRTDVVDTQNGFKLFSQKSAQHIFNKLRTERWSFDVEALLLAKRGGFKIKEVPIVWVNDDRSRMRFSQMVRMLIDLLRISFF